MSHSAKTKTKSTHVPKFQRRNILTPETPYPAPAFYLKLLAVCAFLNLVLGFNWLVVAVVAGVCVVAQIKTRPFYPGGPPYIYGTWSVMSRSFYQVFAHVETEEMAVQYERSIERKLEDILEVEEGQGITGFSCRVIFDMFLRSRSVLDDSKKKVLCTPFMHTSFPKSMGYNDMEVVLVDLDEDLKSFVFDENEHDPTEFSACVITHAFGFDFNVDNMVAWANKHNIPVFEDAVQAQLFPLYKGHPGATVVAFSGGVDKIPVSFGGGYAIVRDPEARELLHAELNALPRQNSTKRFWKLLEHLILWTVYRNQALLWVMHGVANICGVSVTTVSWTIRLKLSGFVHDRHKYLRRPSVAQLASMDEALDIDWTFCHERMTNKRFKLREFLGEKYSDYFLPWDTTHGDSAPYYHVLVDNPLEFIEYINDNAGMNVMLQVSWYDPVDSPKASALIKKLVILPSVFSSSDEQMKNFSRVLITYAENCLSNK